MAASFSLVATLSRALGERLQALLANPVLAHLLPAREHLLAAEPGALGNAIILMFLATLMLAVLFSGRRKPSDDVPVAPGAIWLIGHALKLTDPEHHLWSTTLADSIGPIFRFLAPFGSLFVITDVKAAREILGPGPKGGHDKLRNLYDKFADMYGNHGVGSLLTSPTDVEWRHRRKSLQPAFDPASVRASLPVIHEKCAEAVGILAALGDQEVIDVDHLLISLTVDVIGRAALNYEFGALSGGPDGPGARFCACIPLLFEEFVIRSSQFWRRWLPWIFPTRLAAIRASKEVQGISLGVLAANRAAAAASGPPPASGAPPTPGSARGPPPPGSAIARLLAATDSKGQPASLISQMADCFVLVVAGHDTTGHTAAYALWAIGTDARVEAKLMAELDAVLGDDPTPAADLLSPAKLPYLSAVCKETLRHYTMVPDGSVRMAERRLTVGPHTIEKGAWLWIPFYPLMHSKHSGFERPNDFWPERWLAEGAAADGEGAAAARAVPGAESFLPFSFGPRDCLGQTFALLELRAVLTALLRKFTFRPAPGFELKLRASTTLQTMNGVRMTATPRAAAAAAPHK